MFPFAFGVPLASRHNSPAASKSPPNANSNPFNIRPIALNGDSLYTESYAQKKANWKSSLRKAHPFLSNETNRAHKQSNLDSNTSTSDPNRSSRQKKKASRRSLLTIRHILTVSVLVLCVAVVIVGVIWADKIIPRDTTPAGASFPTLQIGNTKTDDDLKDGGELRARVGKRIDTAPFPEENPFEHADSDKSSLTKLLAGMGQQARLQSPSLMAQLFFYVAALPIVTIIHACAELAVFSLIAQLRQRSSTSSPTPSVYDDDDSFCDSDEEDINEEKFKHELAYPALPVSPEFKSSSRQQNATNLSHKKLTSLAPILSIVSSVLILQGWIVINGIQVFCEFIPSSEGTKVCPSPLSLDGLNEIKGHQQMSIARTALSWAIVLIYIVQIVITFKQYKLFSLRCFRRSRSRDTEASPKQDSTPNPSPRTLNSILTRGRSRSNSSRRKTVRFDLEEASRRQSEKGDDVQYIPAPSDGYDNGYGLTYNYSSNYAYAPNGTGSSSSDVRTPWQWQGQFEEFVNRTQTTSGINTNPVVAATIGTGTKVPAVEKTGGSFDFGLASMRRLAREENAALAHKTGFHPSQLYNTRNSHGLTSHPTVGVAVDQEARNLTADTSAIVPIALSNTTVPFKPKFVATQPAHVMVTDLSRNDTVVSAMTNGRKSVDLNAIDEVYKREVSPLSSN